MDSVYYAFITLSTIGFGDMVEVNEGQCADAAARQGFCGPGAHPANADNNRMRATDTGRRRLAIATGHAAETTLSISGLRGRLGGTDR